MEKNREAAARKGDQKYTGPACKKCGGTERYTANGNCVECSKVASGARAKKIKALMDAAKAKKLAGG